MNDNLIINYKEHNNIFVKLLFNIKGGVNQFFTYNSKQIKTYQKIEISNNDFYFSVCLLNNLFELAGESCRFLSSELEEVAQDMIVRNGNPEDLYLHNNDFSLCVINEFICNLDFECEWVNNSEELTDILDNNILEDEKLIGVIAY